MNITGWATLGHQLKGPAPDIVRSSDIPESFAPGTELANRGPWKSLRGTLGARPSNGITPVHLLHAGREPLPLGMILKLKGHFHFS